VDEGAMPDGCSFSLAKQSHKESKGKRVAQSHKGLYTVRDNLSLLENLTPRTQRAKKGASHQKK